MNEGKLAMCVTQKKLSGTDKLSIGAIAKNLLGIVHVDVSPVKTMSIDNFKYPLGFVDSFSRLGAVYILRTRAEAGIKLSKSIDELEKLRTNVTDNNKEFKLVTFADICLHMESIRSLLLNIL